MSATPTYTRETERLVSNLYISDRAMDVFRDHVANMPENLLAHALVTAFCMGNLNAVETILELRAPFPINYRRQGFVRTLNDQPLVLPAPMQPFPHCETQEQLTRLLEMAPAIGLGFLTGADGQHSEMFNCRFIEKIDIHEQAVFAGQLPVVENQMIRNPELINAMISKRNSSAYPLAYDRVLCFVPEDEANRLGEGYTPLKVIQEVTINISFEEEQIDHKKRVKSQFTLDGSHGDQEQKNKALALLESLDKQTHLNSGDTLAKELTIEAIYSLYSMRRSTKALEPKDIIAIHSQTLPAMKRGFDIPDGYVPCVVRLDKLESLPQAALRQENVDAANTFIRNYNPLMAIAFSYDMNQEMDYSMINWKVGAELYNSQVLEALLYDDQLKRSLLDRIPTPVWHQLFIDNRSRYASYAAGNKVFGFDNKGAQLKFTTKKLAAIKRLGAKLHPDTRILAKDIGKYPPSLLDNGTFIFIEDLGEMPELVSDPAARTLMSMGVWPATVDVKNNSLVAPQKPDSIEKLVSSAARLKDLDTTSPYKCALRIMLKEHGAQECAAVAKTEKQWVMLQQVFGNELGPFMEKAPHSVKRKAVMESLGM